MIYSIYLTIYLKALHIVHRSLTRPHAEALLRSFCHGRARGDLVAANPRILLS